MKSPKKLRGTAIKLVSFVEDEVEKFSKSRLRDREMAIAFKRNNWREEARCEFL